MLTSLMAIYMALMMVITPYCDTKQTLTTFCGDHVYVIETVTDYRGETKSELEYTFTPDEYKEWLKNR